MPNESGREKRRKHRVEFTTHIHLTVGESEIHVEGSSKDLSLKGVFVNTKEDIPIGSKCNVRVVLSGMIEKVILEINGSVVRKQENGAAVEFGSMDIDSYTHLKNIVRYNITGSENPDDVF